MTVQEIAKLVDYIKVQCNYQWIDDNMRMKLSNIIMDGIAYLDNVYGKENDYTKEGLARSLLVNYVLYAQANALDDFSKNYKQELLSLNLSGNVSDFVEEDDA